MIAIIVTGVLAIAVLAAWRRAYLASHPERWPTGLSFARQLRLARAYLKHNGWKFIEPIPPMFIRGQKGGLGLSLVIHAEETLSLPTLLKDCINIAAPNGITIGILSQQTLEPEFQADASRNGIYIINPADLPNLAAHIQRAALNRKQMKDAGLPAKSNAASAMSRALSA